VNTPRHMLRLRHATPASMASRRAEIILLKFRHDGTSCYQMLAGHVPLRRQERLVCGAPSPRPRSSQATSPITSSKGAYEGLTIWFEASAHSRDAMAASHSTRSSELLRQIALTLKVRRFPGKTLRSRRSGLPATFVSDEQPFGPGAPPSIEFRKNLVKGA